MSFESFGARVVTLCVRWWGWLELGAGAELHLKGEGGVWPKELVGLCDPLVILG